MSRVQGLDLESNLTTGLSHYWQSFQLTCDPFDNSHRDHQYFATPSWEEDIDLMQHLLRYSNVLLAVCGDKGTGKTTMMQEFMAQIGEGICQLSIDGNKKLSTTALLKLLVEGFNLPDDSLSRGSISERLDSAIEQLQHTGKTNLLLIDHAEQLSSELITALIYLISQQSESQMRFHVLLFGENEMVSRLRRISGEVATGDITQFITLKPFSIAETKNYLAHRLEVAGYTGVLPLNEAMITRIHKFSNGYPGRINQVAQQILQDKFRQGENMSQVSFWQANHTKIIGGACMVVALAVCSFVLVRNTNTPTAIQKNIPIAIQPSASQQTATLQKVGTLHDKLPPINTANERDQVITTDSQTAQKMAALTRAIQQSRQQQPANSSNPTAELSTTKRQANQQVQKSAPEPQRLGHQPQVISKPTQLITNPPQQFAKQSVMKLQPIAAAKKTIVPQPTIAIDPPAPKLKPVAASKPLANVTSTHRESVSNQPNLTSEIPVKPKSIMISNHHDVSKPVLISNHPAVSKPIVITNKPVALSIKKTAPSKPKAATVASRPFTQAERVILATNQRHYTLQILGAHNKAHLAKFIRNNHLTNRYFVYQTQYNNQDWFVLVYGNYPSSQSARKAIKSLPSSVQALKPWPRRYSEIQKVLHAKNHAVKISRKIT